MYIVPIGAPKDLSDCRKFFLEPDNSKHRMYEALRAYFVDERPSSEVAHAFGYTPGSFQVLCHHFRRNPNPLWRLVPICSRSGAFEVGSIGRNGSYARIENDSGRTCVAQLSGSQALVY